MLQYEKNLIEKRCNMERVQNEWKKNKIKKVQHAILDKTFSRLFHFLAQFVFDTSEAELD